jgi:predicted RNA-binding Zn ribbon-like protein
MVEITRTVDTLELLGGALCLDFINTVNARPRPEHDYLMNYSDLVDWAYKLGVLSARETKQFRAWEPAHIKEAGTVLQSARSLREFLYRLFANPARESKQNSREMSEFPRYYGQAVADSQLVKKGDQYLFTWSIDETLSGLISQIIYSAGELLLQGKFQQVKECPGCGWLFLDTSKNQSRRWCSMNTCGARDKMRRYHTRQRSK